MKSKKLPSPIILLILTVITALFWVSTSVVNLFSKEDAPVVPEEIINPLNPTLDVSVINEIKNRLDP